MPHHLTQRFAPTLFLLICGWGSTISQAADTLDTITSRIAQHNAIRAQFVQTKKMAALKKPLVIQGNLLYVKNEGVLWEIERPYRITYVLNDSRIVEIAANGTRQVRNARDVPGLSQIGQIFQAMLGGDAAALTKYFDARIMEQPSQWDVLLKPRQQQLQQFLTQIQLSGDEFVQDIVIGEANGDTTQIHLNNAQAVSLLGDNERRLLRGDTAVQP